MIAVTTQTRYGPRHSHCGLWSWEGKPLVTAETHAARQTAHAAFDPVWKRGLMTRQEAYARLAAVLGQDETETHISLMTAEQAARVPSAVVKIYCAMLATRFHEDSRPSSRRSKD